MKYKLEYLSTFYAEIPQIADYLAAYPAKAARVFAQIDKALGDLQDMPERDPVYRFFTVEDYLILYKVNKQSRIIEVHHLLNGRMDILTKLKGWNSEASSQI